MHRGATTWRPRKARLREVQKTVTEELVLLDTGIASPSGVIEDYLKMTLDQFKGLGLKVFAARHQVNYLRQNMHKPVGVTARVCAGRFQEISNYLEYFPGPDSNDPLTKGDLINILNQMVPVQCRRSMITINFQPFTKSMMKVIEYMEKLEALEATTKYSGKQER